MHILLSNDDGFYAKGLRSLYESLKNDSSNYKISIAAPDRNCSGASSSLTLNAPLTLREIEKNQFCIQGTPADCVHIALTGLVKDTPEIIISGINFGSNLGDDTLYSGTVAAAIEGRHLGVLSIAISLCIKQDYEKLYFDTATQYLRIILDKIKKTKDFQTKKLTGILNINVPNVPFSEIKGIQVTRLGFRHMAQNIIEGKDPRGRKIYWIGSAGESADNNEGTDFFAIENNYVSITPIHTDLTSHNEIKSVQSFFNN